MNEYLGRHVKCFLRNSTVVEGVVKKWGDILQLQSLDGKSLLIIHQPTQDIVLTKVLLSEDVVEPVEESLIPQPPVRGRLSSDDEPLEVVRAEEEESDPMALQAKSTAELRIEMAKQERKIIAGKLKDHRPDSLQTPRKVKYGQPGFLQNQSTK